MLTILGNPHMFGSILHSVFLLLVMIIFFSSIGMIVFHRLPFFLYRMTVLSSMGTAVALWGYLTFYVHALH